MEEILRWAKQSKMMNRNAFMGQGAFQGNGIVCMDMKDLIGTKTNGIQLVTVKIVVINLVTDGVAMNNPVGVNLNKSGVNLWLALKSECHNICNEW